ncbi:hypothetical protein ARMSODRAFT_723546 [Armillaria solidipes]|uniref:Uncharacterized protein n=1 Tax=Armillaria solidipes TaxID=1076256 RepID=A0A2H3AST2_9AGAR|nr:hypothetical protein ARMSODRAFT_723546 [Armillaria solidipes]
MLQLLLKDGLVDQSLINSEYIRAFLKLRLKTDSILLQPLEESFPLSLPQDSVQLHLLSKGHPPLKVFLAFKPMPQDVLQRAWIGLALMNGLRILPTVSGKHYRDDTAAILRTTRTRNSLLQCLRDHLIGTDRCLDHDRDRLALQTGRAFAKLEQISQPMSVVNALRPSQSECDGTCPCWLSRRRRDKSQIADDVSRVRRMFPRSYTSRFYEGADPNITAS